MNNSKVKKYLGTKNIEDYTQLDVLLSKYYNGELSSLLSKYKFTKTDVFPKISKEGNCIDICLLLQNITANISLTENTVEYSIIPVHSTIKLVEDNTVEFMYDLDFSFEELLKLLYEKMKNHDKIKDISQQIKKEKIFNVFSNMCLIIPFAFISLMVVLVVGFKFTIMLNFTWVLFFIIIPLILHVFLKKYKKHS